MLVKRTCSNSSPGFEPHNPPFSPNSRALLVLGKPTLALFSSGSQLSRLKREKNLKTGPANPLEPLPVLRVERESSVRCPKDPPLPGRYAEGGGCRPKGGG